MSKTNQQTQKIKKQTTIKPERDSKFKKSKERKKQNN